MTGPELVAQWRAVRAPVAAAWRGTPDDDEVHLSYGSAPVGHYLAQQTFDLAVHAWDIAGAQAAGLKGVLVQRTAEQVANPLAPPLVIGRDLQEAMALILAHEDRHP